MEKFDFLRKELVRTFSYSTINEDRFGYINYEENGRKYTKYGTWQAVTYIGLLYKVFDKKSKVYKYIYHVGMTKQHPCDIQVDKQLAYETAYTNALMEPNITITWDQKPSTVECMNIIRYHMCNLRLRFVKTKAEITKNKLCQI